MSEACLASRKWCCIRHLEWLLLTTVTKRWPAVSLVLKMLTQVPLSSSTVTLNDSKVRRPSLPAKSQTALSVFVATEPLPAI